MWREKREGDVVSGMPVTSLVVSASGRAAAPLLALNNCLSPWSMVLRGLRLFFNSRRIAAYSIKAPSTALHELTSLSSWSLPHFVVGSFFFLIFLNITTNTQNWHFTNGKKHKSYSRTGLVYWRNIFEALYLPYRTREICRQPSRDQ